MDINLPTGKTDLSIDELALILDPKSCRSPRSGRE
jgi:hypothetical protein